MESASLCDWAGEAAVMGQKPSFPMASKSCCKALYPKRRDDVTAFLPFVYNSLRVLFSMC